MLYVEVMFITLMMAGRGMLIIKKFFAFEHKAIKKMHRRNKLEGH